ncbi:hypothetical protein M8J77_025606 [Diaphorina citri]|nr:hypothetical protein M8J77_025606 [Diaphorina citri]
MLRHGIHLSVASLLVISISCQIFPNVNNNFQSDFPPSNLNNGFQTYQQIPNGFQTYQAIPNGFQNYQKNSNGFQNYQNIPNGFQNYQQSPSGFQNVQQFGNGFNGVGGFQSGSSAAQEELVDYYRPGQNYTDRNSVTFQDGIVTQLAYAPCYRDDPQVSSCMKNLLQKMFPAVADGYKPFNVPPIDPMVVKPISLNFPSSLFGGTLDVTNVKVNGISKAKIMNLKANVNDVNKFRITMDVYYPHVLVTGNYKMVGNIARIPIKTDGDWSAALDGVTVLWEIKGLPEQRSQNVFLRMNRFGFRSQPEFKHLKFYASNLVPRNENLTLKLGLIIANLD